MKSTVNRFAGRNLLAWVAFVQRHAGRVLAAIAVATLVFAATAALKLGVNSNNLDLLSPELDARVYQAEFSALFPGIANALLVVVDAQTPTAARDAARELSDALNQRPQHIEGAYIPGGGEFFARQGLLYLDLDELENVETRFSQARPFLLSLEAQPNLVGLSDLIVKNMRATRFNFDYEETWTPVLGRLDKTIDSVLQQADQQTQTSLFAGLDSFDTRTRYVIIVNPVLEFGSLLAADQAIESIRTAARDLDLNTENGISVRITGNPAINQQEMQGIAWDVGLSAIACLALIVIILMIALRAPQLVAATGVTLIVGLIWMAGLAAATVGHLNIVSVSVAILFIGLGVDFAIHLGMNYAAALSRGIDAATAMQESIEKIGGSLLICTVSTSIAFLVFVPTAYLGVAELGLIAGMGMLVIFFLTVTLFPALLASGLSFCASKHIHASLRFKANFASRLQQHSRLVLGAALLLLVAGLVLVPRAGFDANVIDMRDPSTESVQAFNALLDESGFASPWYIDVVTADKEEAQQLASRLADLSAVKHTLTIHDSVPMQQQEKLKILSSLKQNFSVLEQAADQSEPDIGEQLAALKRLQQYLLQDAKQSETDAFAEKQRALANRLATLIADPGDENTLNRLRDGLIGDLDTQLARIRNLLSASPVTEQDLPLTHRQSLLADSGQARVQVYPRENLRDKQNLQEFVATVQAVAPRATGMPATLIAFEQATKDSFVQALLSAFILITLLLIYLWRNLVDVVLVLGPLLLSLLTAVSCMVLLGLPFNFTNIVVIPLMLGIGVDSGIHLVYRSQQIGADRASLLNTTTARAVYYSALTTLLSFGSLAFSSHRGMQSMGVLLAIGMTLTLICNLIVLPALLELRQRGWRW